MGAVSVAFSECEHECTEIILKLCVKPKVWYDFFYRYFTAPFKTPFGKRKPLFQDVQYYRETAAANQTEEGKKHSPVQYEFLLERIEIFYFLLRTSQFLQSQTKDPRQYTMMTKKCVTSCNTIWRCLFMPDRCGNESFVLILPIFSGIISMNNVVKQCSRERTVSFSILSIIDLKIMYIRGVSGK